MTVVYDIVPFDTLVKQAAFLHVVFGEDWEEKAFLVNEPDWGVRKKLESLDPTKGCYWCVGAIPWGKARKIKNVENVRALVLDDVGTKINTGSAMALSWELGAGAPSGSALTAIVGTSEKNFQYIFSFGNRDLPDAKTFKRLRKQILGGLQGTSDGKDAVHFFRLPWGVNRKPDREMFRVNGRFGVWDGKHEKPLDVNAILAAARQS